MPTKHKVISLHCACLSLNLTYQHKVGTLRYGRIFVTVSATKRAGITIFRVKTLRGYRDFSWPVEQDAFLRRYWCGLPWSHQMIILFATSHGGLSFDTTTEARVLPTEDCTPLRIPVQGPFYILSRLRKLIMEVGGRRGWETWRLLGRIFSP